jgi:hypothetical protein
MRLFWSAFGTPKSSGDKLFTRGSVQQKTPRIKYAGRFVYGIRAQIPAMSCCQVRRLRDGVALRESLVA